MSNFDIDEMHFVVTGFLVTLNLGLGIATLYCSDWLLLTNYGDQL